MNPSNKPTNARPMTGARSTTSARPVTSARPTTNTRPAISPSAMKSGGKTLVIAEKPSVGRDIGRVLKCNMGQRNGGFLEGGQYVVTWALGHLVTLASPEKYDVKYEKWSLETLPMIPEPMQLEVIPQTSKQYKVIKDLLNRSDISNVVIATDAGREGELVARWILEKAKSKKPIKRLWISSVTDQAILNGFSQLKDGKLYEHLYASAVARSEADWLVGLNASRALTCKFNAQLSCGRVQTPTLAIIAQRENEIKSFVPESYYGVECQVEGTTFRWQNPKSQGFHSMDYDTVVQLEKELKASGAQPKFTIAQVEKAFKKSFPPALYDLTELQRDANRLYDFSAKETLGVLQGLYEHHKIVTYPRTDSRYLSADIVGTLKDRLKAISIGPYAKYATQILKTPIKATKAFVDDSKVSDHHALIPTEQPVRLQDLSFKERQLYDLIVARFLAVLFPACEFEQMTVTGQINGQNFVAKGNRIIEPGFRSINIRADGSSNNTTSSGNQSNNESDEESDDNIRESVITKAFVRGERYPVSSVKMTQGKTKPPGYFTEGTLLSAMENPRKFMQTHDQTLLKTITETGGLGTVATRADIIEKLLNSFLVEKKGKTLHMTSKGKQLLDLVPEELKSPQLTAEWELKLNQIAKGSLRKQVFIDEMKSYTKHIVQDIKVKEERFHHDNITGSKCPTCGKFMLEVNHKNGRMLVCQDRDCGYRETLAQLTNARCPQCHKKLELVGEGEGKLFVCKCGFKEKLTAFNKRKDETTQNISKKEVARFLQQSQQKQEEPLNNPFANLMDQFKK